MEAIRKDLVGNTYISKDGIASIVAASLPDGKYAVAVVTPEGGFCLCEKVAEEMSYCGAFLGKHIISGRVATRHRYNVVSTREDISNMSLCVPE